MNKNDKPGWMNPRLDLKVWDILKKAAVVSVF
jgi:hypothetical protein